MRWFWLFIASLVVLTVVMYTTRVRAERAQQAAMQAQAEQNAPSTPMRRSRERTARTRDAAPETADDRRAPARSTTDNQPAAQPNERPAGSPETTAAADPQPEPQPQPDDPPHDQTARTPAEASETVSQPADSPSFDPTALITAFNEADAQRTSDTEPTARADASAPAAETETQADAQPATQETAQTTAQQTAQQTTQQESEPAADGFEQALAQAARESSPEQPGTSEDATQAQAQTDNAAEQEKPREDGPRTYELRADGSFRVIEGDVWVQGAGTAAEPYVLSWEVLKAVEKSYDPRNGKETIPDWLDHLDGKVVQIEGNTLVPVVATTTRELLVMQNPWDGCCIGVPPTPYDAVEVALDHDVDFGNTAVGFGSVLGTFYLDPYIVDGWVLGLYLIEDARYRSGEGVEFPQF